MSRALLAVLLVAGACKGKSAPKGETKPPPVDDPHAGLSLGSAPPPVEVDWGTCDAALQKAATAPLALRPQIVIDGCHVCGDWTPILRWNKPHTDGGPSRAEIEAAMLRCRAYCNGDAKQRFLGTLDNARGTSARTPWRQLAEICKEQVSAVPDQRFSSGPYFALDRIARALFERTTNSGATPRAGFDLPLPALSLVGTGISLPSVDDAATIDPGELAITVLGGDAFVGYLPRARLLEGVAVRLPVPGYPGRHVPLAELVTALTTLDGHGPDRQLTLVAAGATPAQKLVPIIEAVAATGRVQLAVKAAGSPEGWDLPAVIPVALEVGGKDALSLSAMTVQQLAAELARRAALKVNRVGVTL